MNKYYLKEAIRQTLKDSYLSEASMPTIQRFLEMMRDQARSIFLNSPIIKSRAEAPSIEIIGNAVYLRAKVRVSATKKEIAELEREYNDLVRKFERIMGNSRDRWSLYMFKDNVFKFNYGFRIKDNEIDAKIVEIKQNAYDAKHVEWRKDYDAYRDLKNTVEYLEQTVDRLSGATFDKGVGNLGRLDSKFAIECRDLLKQAQQLAAKGNQLLQTHKDKADY